MTFRGGLEPFNSRSFRLYWISNLVSNTATWMQQTAEPWLILSVSGSAVLLGLDSFAASAPFFLLALAGGVLADRRDRQKLILRLQGLQMVCPFVIVYMILVRRVDVGLIIALSLVVGITDALSSPALQAIIPSLVEERLIAKAIPLNSTQFNLSRLIGPLLAGATMTGLGVVWCFGVNGLSYVPFLAAIYLLKVPSVPAAVEKEAEPPPTLRGYRTFLKDRRTAFLLRVVFIHNLLAGPVVTFLPMLVRDALRGGAGEFSACLMVFGLGGLAAGGALSLLPASVLGAYGAAALTGVLLMAVAAARGLIPALILICLLGFLFLACNIGANTLLQNEAQSHQRGRVASLYMLATRGGLTAGSLLTGFSAAAFGVQRALFLDGALAILALIIPTLFTVRILRRFAPGLFPADEAGSLPLKDSKRSI